SRYQFTECILRNSAGANAARSPNQNTLHSIADNLARNAARPAICRSIKATPFPPVGIAPGGVYCRLKAARQCLTDLVAGHEQPLARLCARGVKLGLLRIRLVILETIFS